MGISGIAARLIAEEHKYKPLPKQVHLLGRQTIHLSEQDLRRLCAEAGVEPEQFAAESDIQTREALARISAGDQPLLSDTSFFKAFGVQSIRAIDHSDYEGADIVFDLTKSLPPEHEGIADLIYDGSVMDNVFNPAAAMQNVARLLKPGGRYIGQNLATTRWYPSYLAFNPYWFFDFFVANGFRDVKVYVVEAAGYDPKEPWPPANLYLLNAASDHRQIHNFPISAGASNITILAEKGDSSSWDKQTSQAMYRLDDEWAEFDENVSRVNRSARPLLTIGKKLDRDIVPGFIYAGTLDWFGLYPESGGENAGLAERGQVDFATSFDGSGWGAREAHEGIVWRWIDDGQEQSEMVLNLAPGRDHLVEVTIHTCRNSEALYALRATIDGIEAIEQSIDYSTPSPKLYFKVPRATMTSRRIGLLVTDVGRGEPGDTRSVAISRIAFEPYRALKLKSGRA